jgi:endonuclease/exonuclease/phosphatase family metal-dependent hydrolase
MIKKMLNKILFLVCLVMLSSGSVLCQDNGFEFKIISYNIRHASPPSQPATINTDTVAAVIRKYQPDLVALQEVDVNTKRSGKNLDEAKEIGRKTGMNAYFAKAIDYSEGEYGIAILSKQPLDSFRIVPLPSANEFAERRVLAIAFFHVNKQSFVFGCTHLDAEAGDDSRMMQIKVIDSILSLQRFPVLLAGDLNSESKSAVIKYLDRNFVRSCLDNCGLTFPSDLPVKTIDYIACGKSNPCKIISQGALPESYPSDHLPILADLHITIKSKPTKKGSAK